MCKPNEWRNKVAAFLLRNNSKGPPPTEANPLASMVNRAACEAMQKLAGAMAKGGPVGQAALQGMAREMVPKTLLAGARGSRAEGSTQHRPILPETGLSRNDRQHRSQCGNDASTYNILL